MDNNEGSMEYLIKAPNSWEANDLMIHQYPKLVSAYLSHWKSMSGMIKIEDNPMLGTAEPLKEKAYGASESHLVPTPERQNTGRIFYSVENLDLAKPYRCTSCKKSYANRSALFDHVVIHTKEKPFKCKICEKGFGHRKSLSQHAVTHTKEQPYTCQDCGKKYAHRSSLKKHQKPQKCHICGTEFSQKCSLAFHTRMHEKKKPEPYKCDHCDKQFSRKGSLLRHTRNFHVVREGVS